MSQHRFFCPEQLTTGTTIALPEVAASHAARVLRMQVGDHAVLFNGDGFDYACELVSVQKSGVTARILSNKPITNESPLDILLLQGISSGDRMDYTIQKAVELGVRAIQPIATERSVVKLNQERAEKRVAHWQQIVISACEQSGRAFVPTVHPPLTLSQWLTQHTQAQSCRILLNPVGAKQLAQLPKPTSQVQLLIGAEGGLSALEIETATAHGFESILLGPRVLRTETAALAAISSMQTIWGDF